VVIKLFAIRTFSGLKAPVVPPPSSGPYDKKDSSHVRVIPSGIAHPGFMHGCVQGILSQVHGQSSAPAESGF